MSTSEFLSVIELDLPQETHPGPRSQVDSAQLTSPRGFYRRATDWRTCCRHHGRASISICSRCGKAFCEECSWKKSHGYVCPECNWFCVRTEDRLREVSLQNIRQRSLWAELPTILTYPLTDTINFVVLVLFCFAVSFAGSPGSALAMGVMMAYGFRAMSKVSMADMGSYRPSFDSVADDIIKPGRLATCAVLISAGPWVLLHLALPEAGQALMAGQSLGPEALAYAASLLWALFYFPMAFIVAGESRSCRSTLNPIVGLRFIPGMGWIYGQTMILFLVLFVVQMIIGKAFEMGLGAMGGISALVMEQAASSLLRSYVSLSMGCLLGFALLKKGPDADLLS